MNFLKFTYFIKNPYTVKRFIFRLKVNDNKKKTVAYSLYLLICMCKIRNGQERVRKQQDKDTTHQISCRFPWLMSIYSFPQIRM